MKIDEEIRAIFAMAHGCEISEVSCMTHVEFTNVDDCIWFWSEIEDRFDAPITRAEKPNLKTVGDLSAYLKRRIKACAQGRKPAPSRGRDHAPRYGIGERDSL